MRDIQTISETAHRAGPLWVSLVGGMALGMAFTGCEIPTTYCWNPLPAYMADRPLRLGGASEEPDSIDVPPAPETGSTMIPSSNNGRPSSGGQSSREFDESAVVRVNVEEPASFLNAGSFDAADPEISRNGIGGREALDASIPDDAFADRLPSRVTVNHAIAEALANDPEILAAAEAVHEAGGEFVGASLKPNPELWWAWTLLPVFNRFTPEREGGPPQFDAFIEYPIDWWLFGKRLAEMEATRRGVDVAAAAVADTIRQRVNEAILAYYDVLEAKALLELAELDVENLERVEQMTQHLVDSGAVGTIELDRVQLELLSSRRELREARVGYAGARGRLESLMGRDAHDPDFEVVGTLDVVDPAEPLDLNVAFELAEIHRPDLVAAQRQINFETANIHWQERLARPEMSVEVGYTFQRQRTVLQMPDAHSAGVGMSMSLPISDRNQGGRLTAQANYRRALQEYRAARLNLRAELIEAVEAYRQAYGIITTEAPALFESATRVREAFERAYELGDRSFLEILDAQRTFRETSRLFIEGQAGYWRALYELNAAIGARVIE